jgi:hypothetical protein
MNLTQHVPLALVSPLHGSYLQVDLHYVGWLASRILRRSPTKHALDHVFIPSLYVVWLMCPHLYSFCFMEAFCRACRCRFVIRFAVVVEVQTVSGPQMKNLAKGRFSHKIFALVRQFGSISKILLQALKHWNQPGNPVWLAYATAEVVRALE